MKELSKIVYSAIHGAGIVGDNIFPIVANAGAEFPLITYDVEVEQKLTKDKMRRYAVEVKIYHQKYDELLDMIELVDNALENVNWNNTIYRFNQKNIVVRWINDDSVYVGIINYFNTKT